MDYFLEMKGITKSFHGVEVLHGVDFYVEKGEVIALCGENGAGKSTLMKILMGIYKKDHGQIFFDGQVLENHDPLKSLGYGLSMICLLYTSPVHGPSSHTSGAARGTEAGRDCAGAPGI